MTLVNTMLDYAVAGIMIGGTIIYAHFMLRLWKPTPAKMPKPEPDQLPSPPPKEEKPKMRMEDLPHI